MLYKGHHTLRFLRIYYCVWTNQRTGSKHHTQTLPTMCNLSTKCESGTSFSPQKQRKERCLTHNVDEGDYQSCSWLFHWLQTAKNSGGEHRRAVIAFSGRGRGWRETVWTRNKCCENGGAGIFTPRVCAGGLHTMFSCHPFDSIISWRFWRLPLISQAGAAFNTALSF